MPYICGYDRGLSIVIFGADDFPDELYPKVKGVLLEYIENQKVSMVTARGDKASMIYRLFRELVPIYPSVFFSVLLSNDKMAYNCDNGREVGIFSFDPEIGYEDKENAAYNRDLSLVRGADVIILRQASKYNDINNIRFNSLNPKVEIILLK